MVWIKCYDIKNVNYNEFESRFNNLLDTVNSIYKSDTNILGIL